MSQSQEQELVVVGRVRKPHGVTGELSVEVLSENPDRFREGAGLVACEADGSLTRLRITSVRPHRGVLLVRFEGLEDRDEVARLRGAELLVEAAEVGDAPEGAFYYFELVGCACTDRSAGELGRVESVREDGGGLLLEIRDRKRTLLVPFVRAYLGSVDVVGKTIELDLPEGLLETCASPS